MSATVTSTDLVLAIISRKTGKTREQAYEMLHRVRHREPLLSVWLDDVYESADTCADAVIDAWAEA